MYKSYFYRISFILLFFLSFHAKAQEVFNSKTVEEKSLELYYDKNWKELIPFAKEAINKGFDYYYIRMRMGIAYYEQKNYAKAATQFEKALGFDSSDDLAKEYLYYCFVFTERYDEARVLSKKFSSELTAKSGMDKLSSFSFAQVTCGVKLPNKTSYTKQNDIVLMKDEPFSVHVSTNTFDTTTYSIGQLYQISFSHYVKKRFSLFYAFTYYSQQNSHQSLAEGNPKYNVDYKVLNTHPPYDSLHAHKELADWVKNTDKVKQYMIYVNANIPLKHNWSISPAVHYINNSDVHQKDTTILDKNKDNTVIQHMPAEPAKKNNYFVASLNLSKFTGSLKSSLGFTYSDISGIHRYQNNISLLYYIRGNNRLNVGCDGYLLKNLDEGFSPRFGLCPFITVRPFKRFSITAAYLFNTEDSESGNFSNNPIEGNGYLINNSSDKTRSRFSLIANAEVAKHLDIFLAYSREAKEATYPPAPNSTQGNSVLSYNYNNIFIGITLKNFNKTIKHKN